MSVTFIDSFNGYPSSAMGSKSGSETALKTRWPRVRQSIGTAGMRLEAGEGRFGGDAVRFNAGSNWAELDGAGGWLAELDDNPTIFLSFDLRWTGGSGPILRGRIVCFNNDPDKCDNPFVRLSWEISIELDGTLSVHNTHESDSRANGSAEQGFALHRNQWYRLEVELNTTSPTVRIPDRGVSFTGVGTSCADVSDECNQTGWHDYHFYSGCSFYIDNVVTIHDLGGGRVTAIGDDSTVRGLIPELDVTAQWTPLGGGSNFVEVDDPNRDNDTTYVDSADPVKEDLFDLTDLPLPISLAYGVIARTVAQRQDVDNERDLAQIVELSGGTRSTGSGQQTDATKYDELSTIFETAPDGGAWDETKLNGLRSGYSG